MLVFHRYFVISLVIVYVHGKIDKKKLTPPHCTQLTKDTDYSSYYKFDYPTVYITPGQMEAYQKLYCVNPQAVNKAVTVVCDWVAPPQVQFTLGDEYMHVIRIDPTGRYLGNAVINTYQYCSHNMPPYVNISHGIGLPDIRKLKINRRRRTTMNMKLLSRIRRARTRY